MDIKFTTLAKNKEEFDIQLTTKIMNSLDKIAADNAKILTIQFEDAHPYIINDYIATQFFERDGTYLHEGEFYWKKELWEMIQPYCKTCSVTITEKESYSIKKSDVKELK